MDANKKAPLDVDAWLAEMKSRYASTHGYQESLYGFLKDVAAFAEELTADDAAWESFRGSWDGHQKPNRKKPWRHVLRRVVGDGEGDRRLVSKYARVCGELVERKVEPKDFVKVIKELGGIDEVIRLAIERSRRPGGKSRALRVLHVSVPIEAWGALQGIDGYRLVKSSKGANRYELVAGKDDVAAEPDGGGDSESLLERSALEVVG